eukprot:7391369-Prymnesium_polylepis.1
MRRTDRSKAHSHPVSPAVVLSQSSSKARRIRPACIPQQSLTAKRTTNLWQSHPAAMQHEHRRFVHCASVWNAQLSSVSHVEQNKSQLAVADWRAACASSAASLLWRIGHSATMEAHIFEQVEQAMKLSARPRARRQRLMDSPFAEAS